MSPQMSDTAIRKSVTVDRPLEEAFRLYTEQVATWWPFSTHSTGKEEVETVILEGREGGRFYERTKNGDEHLWGTVLVWDPPSRVVHSWHPGRARTRHRRWRSPSPQTVKAPESSWCTADGSGSATGWTR